MNQSIFVMPDWSLAAAIALDRKNRLLWFAAGTYSLAWSITGAWFAPEIRLGKSDLPPAEIARRGRRWLALGWIRHAALATSFAFTAAAALARRPRSPA